MRCFFGAPGWKKDYLLEENAMLQRMLLQEQREKLTVLQELRDERIKTAVLEQEIAQIAAAAQEMGNCFDQYISNNSSSDTHYLSDQAAAVAGHPPLADSQAPFSSPFAPVAMQLQCIPEHAHKQQEVLDLAEQVKDFAAQLQQRLANSSASSSPRAASGTAAATAGKGAFCGATTAAEGMFAHDHACPAHSVSVPSEQPSSADLPMQALAVSRLALQLHQPQSIPGDASSGFSSSCRKSSCTVLGASVDLTSSISSFPSYGNSQQPAPTAQGMLEPLLSASEPELAGSMKQPARSAALRCSVTRGAAAIAGSCASIAAAAAATAAAAAARKAAAAAAMADASQQQPDLRASSESGNSSLRSSGALAHNQYRLRHSSLSASIKQRQQWQQAQEQWDLMQASQQHSSRQGLSPDSLGGSHGGGPTQQATAEPTPAAPAASAVSARQEAGRLPAVPSHLTRPPRMPEPQGLAPQPQQQPQDAQQQPQPFRYGSDRLSALTSPSTGTSSSASGHLSAQRSAGSVHSRPPACLQQARPAAQPSPVGPLHRNLASLGSSHSGFSHSRQA